MLPIQERIIEAYLGLVSSVGIGEITLQKVASKSKVAFGSVRYHFAGPTNPSLEEAAIAYCFSKAQRGIEEALAAAREKKGFDPIRAYVREMFKWSERERKYASFIVHFYHLLGSDRALKTSNAAYLETARARLLALLHESLGKRGLSLRDAASAPGLVLAFHAMILGGIVIALSERRARAFDAQIEAIGGAIETLIASATR